MLALRASTRSLEKSTSARQQHHLSQTQKVKYMPDSEKWEYYANKNKRMSWHDTTQADPEYHEREQKRAEEKARQERDREERRRREEEDRRRRRGSGSVRGTH
jgi:hypothetical protein